MSVVREFEKAFNRQDVDALLACFTERASYRDNFYGEHTGKDSLRSMFQRMFREGRDYHWQMDVVVDGPSAAAAEWSFSYVVSEAVPRSTGRKIRFTGMSVFELEHGLPGSRGLQRELGDALAGRRGDRGSLLGALNASLLLGGAGLRRAAQPFQLLAQEVLPIRLDALRVSHAFGLGGEVFLVAAVVAVEPAGLELIFSKIAIKPGKPVWLGRAGQALVMGLPGNPTSALVTGRLLLAPLLVGLCGRNPDEALSWRGLPLASPLRDCGSRETFHRARRVEDGAEILSNQDSSAQKALAEADLLVRHRAGAKAMAPGNAVEVLDF